MGPYVHSTPVVPQTAGLGSELLADRVNQKAFRGVDVLTGEPVAPVPKWGTEGSVSSASCPRSSALFHRGSGVNPIANCNRYLGPDTPIHAL